MELLLPVALKLFPGMLPSTFETSNEKVIDILKINVKSLILHFYLIGSKNEENPQSKT